MTWGWFLLTALRENLFYAPLLTSGSLSVLSLWMGEGNGNPLQYSCLENPMDGEAWWAAVHGVAGDQT